jgi:hypothetical protein
MAKYRIKKVNIFDQVLFSAWEVRDGTEYYVPYTTRQTIDKCEAALRDRIAQRAEIVKELEL